MCKDFLTKKQKKGSFSATLQIQARKSKHLDLTNIPLFPKNAPNWSKSSTKEIHHSTAEFVLILHLDVRVFIQQNGLTFGFEATENLQPSRKTQHSLGIWTIQPSQKAGATLLHLLTEQANGLGRYTSQRAAATNNKPPPLQSPRKRSQRLESNPSQGFWPGAHEGTHNGVISLRRPWPLEQP